MTLSLLIDLCAITGDALSDVIEGGFAEAPLPKCRELASRIGEPYKRRSLSEEQESASKVLLSLNQQIKTEKESAYQVIRSATSGLPDGGGLLDLHVGLSSMDFRDYEAILAVPLRRSLSYLQLRALAQHESQNQK